MIRQLMARLWNDEAGSVIATEYLMLGTVVALGSAGGMATVRDSINEEYAEMGNAVRETRQAYTQSLPKVQKGKARVGAPAAADTESPAAPVAGVSFACP